MPLRVSPPWTRYRFRRPRPSSTVVSTAIGLSSVPSSRKGPLTLVSLAGAAAASGPSAAARSAPAPAEIGPSKVDIDDAVEQRHRDRRLVHVGAVVDRAAGVEAGATRERDPRAGTIAGGSADRRAGLGRPRRRDADDRCPEDDRGDGDRDDAIGTETADDAHTLTPGCLLEVPSSSVGGCQMSHGCRRADAHTNPPGSSQALGLKGRRGVGSEATGSTQTSDDALDADRRVQQYGLPDGGWSVGARGSAQGSWTRRTIRVADSSWGSLFAADCPCLRAYDIVPNPTTEVATVTNLGR